MNTPSSSDPKSVVDGFYQAFARKDGVAMSSAYAPEATFSDPVFRDLRGAEPGAMWRMLTRPGGDLTVTHEITGTDGDVVRAHWVARYTFTATGKKVENQIDATITVKDGKIVAHTDVFDIGRWVRQAYGPLAAVPPFGALFAAMTRRFAGKQLAAFIAKGR